MPQQHTGNGTSFQHRLWTASWKLVLFVGLFLAIYIPFVLPYLKFPATEYENYSSAFGRAQIEFLALVSVFLAAAAMTRYADWQPLAMLGFSRTKAIRQTALGTLIGSGLVLIAVCLLTMLGMVQLGYGNGPLNNSLAWSALALLFNVVSQEIFVHGYVQQMVRGKFGATAGVFVSSFVFVLLHYAFFNLNSLLLLTNLFAAGALLGIVFLTSRTLWLPIGIHFGWNFFQGPILGLPITTVDMWDSDLVILNGPNLLTGGETGIEGGVVCSVVFVLAALRYYRVWRLQAVKSPELEYSIP